MHNPDTIGHCGKEATLLYSMVFFESFLFLSDALFCVTFDQKTVNVSGGGKECVHEVPDKLYKSEMVWLRKFLSGCVMFLKLVDLLH